MSGADDSSATSAGSPSLERGQRLGRYELLLPIARGGMAEVWVARQTGMHGFSRIVALKSILPGHSADGSFQRMFLDEARIAARLRHANVVEVLDLGQDGPLLYLVMPLIDGDAVSGLLRRHKDTTGKAALPVGIAARIMADACAGLHAAHQLTDEDGKPLEIVHRDVSPHNILVGVDGTSRITDFGIAKALGRIEQTDVGQVKGKFAYMSPEQVARDPLDARSDVFAAGIVLWELLAGKRLFYCTDLLETARRVLLMPIPRLSEVAPDVPVGFSDVCSRALSRDKYGRFLTIAEMQKAIEAASSESGSAAHTADVAEWVSSLVHQDITTRREKIRAFTRVEAQPPGPDAGAATVSGTVSLPNLPPVPRKNKLVWMVGIGLVAAAGMAAAALYVRRQPAPTPEVTVGAESPSPSPSPPSVKPAIAPQVDDAKPAPSATASAPVPQPAKSTRAPHPKPRVVSKEPKFGNPYAK